MTITEDILSAQQLKSQNAAEAEKWGKFVANAGLEQRNSIELLLLYEKFVDKPIVLPTACSPVGLAEWVPCDGWSLLAAMQSEHFALPDSDSNPQKIPLYRLGGHRTLQTLRRIITPFLVAVPVEEIPDDAQREFTPLQSIWRNLRYLHDTDWFFVMAPICPYSIHQPTVLGNRNSRMLGVTWGDVALLINCDHYIQRFIYMYRWLIFMKQSCNINPLIPVFKDGQLDPWKDRLCRNYLHVFASLHLHRDVMRSYGIAICAAYQHPQATNSQSVLQTMDALFEEMCSVYNVKCADVTGFCEYFSIRRIEENCNKV